MKLNASAHVDHFTRNHLPAQSDWPELLLEGFEYPERLNAAEVLTDGMVDKGFGDHIALIGNGRSRTYKELSDWSSRLAHALVDDLGIVPGNRVLIRSLNTPAMVACWLAVTKIGAVAVNTMAMFREPELTQVVNKGEISHALCDARLLEELQLCADRSEFLKTVACFDGTSNHNSELDRLALQKPVKFECVKTSQDDVALLGFTSGSTGQPKATMHFHRDLLIIADAYAKEVLQVTPDDVFVGSPPLAFTFGLGGLAIFPLRFGATAVLLEDPSPVNLVDMIENYKATICFTAPTAYRVMLDKMAQGADLSSLRVAVSAGENLPEAIHNLWVEKTGKPILNGIGSTEMLHIFISNTFSDSRPGTTGKPIKGYQAKIIDASGKELPADCEGRLAIKGPTGCRYMNDSRQKDYVLDGWNVTGDTFRKDEQGSYYFIARNDDMIISSGYNIAAPEVENALLTHESVQECCVIAKPDEQRGHIVEAHVVLVDGFEENESTVKLLQDHVKQTIAPFKYPRSVCFHDNLPKTHTGKIQRFKLAKNN